MPPRSSQPQKSRKPTTKKVVTKTVAKTRSGGVNAKAKKNLAARTDQRIVRTAGPAAAARRDYEVVVDLPAGYVTSTQPRL